MLMVDAWRQKYPKEFKFTWYRLQPVPVFT